MDETVFAFRWDLAKLHREVERRHGEEQARHVGDSCQSLVKRRMHALYHYGEARRLALDDMKASDQWSVLVRYVFSDVGAMEARGRDEAEAHLIAFMQALHTTGDILSHIIYLSLGLNLHGSTQLDERAISAHSVNTKLHPGSPVRVALGSMLTDQDIKHTAALVNCSKHRTIVQVPASVDFVDGLHGLVFSAFTHLGRLYPKRWANELTRAAFDRYQFHTLAIGSALMRELGI